MSAESANVRLKLWLDAENRLPLYNNDFASVGEHALRLFVRESGVNATNHIHYDITVDCTRTRFIKCLNSEG